MKRKLLYTLMFSSVIGLQACGGGGGGGSPGAPSYLAPSATPTAVVRSFNPLVGAAGFVYSTVNMYNADLTGNGTDNVVVAGSSTTNTSSVMKVFGWSGNNLVDQTAQWFDPGDNIINPGAAKVSFGNFSGNGRQSMFVDPGTDNNGTPASSVSIFVNNGSKFTKYNIALPQTLDSMDSATFTYNGVDNIMALGFPFSEAIMGSPTNNFRAYAVSNLSGSAIASGNFLGTGDPSFVVGQYGSSTTLGATPNALVGFNQDPTTNAVTTPFIRNLPVPLFNTAPYFAQTGGSNTIRVVKYDFDGSGADSVFITAMPNNWQISPYQSSIQFLKNNGLGVFTDVTSTTVTGYDMTKAASTNPIVADIYGTGLPAIILPATNGTQVLAQVSRGQYVASMANTITTFQNNVNSLVGSTLDTQGGTTTFVKGPNNAFYLLDMVPLNMPDGTSQKGFYLTPLTSSTVATNAQSAINLARTVWPWLSDTQLNSMIRVTGSNFAGATVIDEQALFSPNGGLSIFNRPISGYLAGIQTDGADSQVTTVDKLGRTFTASLAPLHANGWSNSYSMNGEHIDQYELTGHTEYLISGSVNNIGPLRVGSETRNMYNTMGSPGDTSLGPTLNQIKNYTIGIPRIWEKGNWSAGAQYTTLSYNPWLAFGGSWGMVTQTGNLDHTIRYINNGFTAVVGGTYTTTNITPGLITRVNDIYGVWGEAGYRFANDVGVYAGVKPVVLSGNVQANLPTGVDNSGNIVYTGKTLALQNQTTGYLRALWTTNFDKKTMYRLSGTVMTNGQSRIMNELRYNFD